MPSERVQRQIDALLDEAEAATKQSNWALVRDRAQNALALDPENADARTYLAAADRAPGGPPIPNLQPLAAHPRSFCDGRYRVHRFLGEGGKKRGYLAHDAKLDGDARA
jgi:hypothetical protein